MDRRKDGGRRQTASDDFRAANRSRAKSRHSFNFPSRSNFLPRRSVVHLSWSRPISSGLFSILYSPLLLHNLIPQLVVQVSVFMRSLKVGIPHLGLNYVSKHKLVREKRTGMRVSIVSTSLVMTIMRMYVYVDLTLDKPLSEIYFFQVLQIWRFYEESRKEINKLVHSIEKSSVEFLLSELVNNFLNIFFHVNVLLFEYHIYAIFSV